MGLLSSILQTCSWTNDFIAKRRCQRGLRHHERVLWSRRSWSISRRSNTTFSRHYSRISAVVAAKSTQIPKKANRGLDEILECVTTQLKEGRAPQCFVKQFSESGYKSQGISNVQAAYVADSKSLNFHLSLVVNHEIELRTVLAMIEAGSETTSSALNSVIKFLEAYPDVQRKAREEIFSAVGNDRTRTYSDCLIYPTFEQ